MTCSHLKVIDKRTKDIIIEGEFQYIIRLDESTWLVEDHKTLNLILEKATENIWTTIFKGDKEIDSTKVDNSKRLDEFDSETQVFCLYTCHLYF